MRIAVACPSYKRPKVKTLDYLPYCEVFVDGKEGGGYKANNPEENIIICPDGVQGNVSRVRNYILDYYFEKGYDSVCIIDDDMEGLYRYEVDGFFGYVKKKLNSEEFMEFLEHATFVTKEWGYKLCGVNPTPDKKAYRHFTPFSTVQFIGGPFSIHLNNPLRYDERLSLKEDYDLTIKHCREYRGALRFNAYHYNVEQAKQAGGCATYRTSSRELEQLEMLEKKWGTGIVKRDKTSRRGFDFNPIIKIPIKGV